MENPTYEENRETQIPETTWEKLKPETIHRNNNPNPKEKLLKLNENQQEQKNQEDNMNITLYTTTTCHKCARMKKQLQKSNTPYKEVILEEYEQIKKITAKANKTSVPIMKKGNKWLTEEETYEFLEMLDD